MVKIYDSIHEYINLDPIIKKIIDTPIFQRLRNIHQTGILYLVFPTATHSRFEHSIGTYHLATLMITNIAKIQPELKISDELILLVGIAGLCHDLGHLVFSHLFDDIFLPNLPNYKSLGNLVHHENRSIHLLKELVKKYNINLNEEQLMVISDLINPKHANYSKWNDKYKVGEWIFQIISNPVNSIDVDKFDYLVRDTKAVGLKFSFNYSRIINDARVINNNICYSSQCSEDIYQMFFIRYRMHRTFYNHKAVKSIEILITKLLFELENEYKISEYINDTDKMLTLVDSYILNHQQKNIKKIMDDIYERKIPKMIYQNISINVSDNDKNIEDKFNKEFDNHTFNIIKMKVGYVNSNTNPLDHIYSYDKNYKIIEKKANNFSLLINNNHQENIFRVYCIDLSIIDKMKNLLSLIN